MVLIKHNEYKNERFKYNIDYACNKDNKYKKGDKMNYENWTNGQLTTYNNKRVSRGIIKNISFKVARLFKKRKMLSNHYFVRMNMSNGNHKGNFRTELNMMKVAN